MSSAIQSHSDRQHFYSELERCAIDTPNSVWLAQIVASWRAGLGVLPDYLGLEPESFERLLGHYFPGFPVVPSAVSGRTLDFSRMLEKDDLIRLLQSFGNDSVAESDCIVGLIVAGCLGSDHLWKDLGLWSRQELSGLLQYNFPALAVRNDRDMKWKKFLYKQLCDAEGLYLCRAPSCDVCVDHPKCFGPEED